MTDTKHPAASKTPHASLPRTESFDHFEMPSLRPVSEACHAAGCPLREKGDQADSIIYEAAHYGWKDRNARCVLDAVAVCDHCRERFRQHTTQRRQEEYTHVQKLAQSIGGMRQYRSALKQNRVWITEDIQDALSTAPGLITLCKEPEAWVSLFHAYVSLMREACDVRHPELPFVRLTSGLIPQDWQERDALEYIATESDLGNRSIAAGLAELDRLIREHADLAVEPLGWFIADENGQLCLIGWEGLLEPQYGDVGTRSRIIPQENSAMVTNSLSKENADFLERIREAARARNVPI